MTLCIAALCKEAIPTASCIVLCFDSKVATESFASETEHKFHVLSNRIMALAADRPGRARELAGIFRDHLSTVQITDSNLLDVLREPLQKFKRKIAAAYVGRKLGLSYQEFLDHGLAWFGQDAFDKYRRDIEDNPLGVEMAIAGFIDEDPFIAELRNGEIERVTNFSLIGTGAYTAEPALHAREQNPNTPLPEALYSVYEAKQIAETSPYVGKETRMYVLRPSDPGSEKLRVSVLGNIGLELLEQRFKEYGPRPLPPVLTLPSDAFIAGLY
jgi:20S proteasome alpha/beta subunit